MAGRDCRYSGARSIGGIMWHCGASRVVGGVRGVLGLAGTVGTQGLEGV